MDMDTIEKRGAEFDLGDLGRAVEAETGMPRATVITVLNQVAGVLPAILAQHDRIEIPGIGVLFLEERSPRVGYNFQDGEAVEIPARTKVVFNAATPLVKEVGRLTGKNVY